MDFSTRTTTGLTVYALIRNSSAQIWNTNTSAFENFNSGNYSYYTNAMTEEGDGYYSGSMPAGITSAGLYNLEFFSGSGTTSDAFITGGTLNWDGTAENTPPIGDALTSLSYFKDYAGITDSSNDTYFQNRIYSCSVALSRILDRTFPIADYVDLIDGPGSTSLQLPHYPVNTVTQIIFGYYTGQTIVTSSDIIINGNTGLISVSPLSTTGSSWFDYDRGSVQQNIQVTYSAGYATIPFDLQDVVCEAVYRMFKLRGANTTMKSETLGSYSYTRQNIGRMFDDDLLATVSHYRDIAV